jgi:hypothetical protein
MLEVIVLTAWAAMHPYRQPSLSAGKKVDGQNIVH